MTFQYSDSFDDFSAKSPSSLWDRLRVPNARLIAIVLGGAAVAFAILGYIHLLRTQLAAKANQELAINTEFQGLKQLHAETLINRIEDFSFDPRQQTTTRQRAREFVLSSLPETANDERLSNGLDISVPNNWNASLKVIHATVGENYRHIDIRVEDPTTHQFVQNLERKDFELSINGKRVSQAIVQKIETNLERRAIALVQDKSSSMHGLPDTHATQAMSWFIGAYAGASTKMKPWKFSNEARAVTPWTSDKELLLEACKPETPSGATSLYLTFDKVVEDLARRSELRTLILLTDGADSKNSTLPTRGIEERCRLANITVHIIGLKSQALNETSLQALATATGGKYLTADDSSQIIARLKEIAQKVFVPAYRIIAFVPNDASGPMSLSVGNTSIDVNP